MVIVVSPAGPLNYSKTHETTTTTKTTTTIFAAAAN